MKVEKNPALLTALVLAYFSAPGNCQVRPASSATRPVEQAENGDGRSVTDQLLSEATALDKEGKIDQAIAVCKKAIATAEAMPSPPPDLVAQTHVHLANTYMLRGNFFEAGGEASKGVSILEKSYGPQSPMLLEGLNVLANSQMWQAKYGLAEENIKRALALLGPAGNSPQAAPLLEKLASLYRLHGQAQKAEPLLKQVLNIAEQEKPQNPSHIAAALGDLSSYYALHGQINEAEQLAEKVAQLIDTTGGEDSQRSRFWSYLRLSGIHVLQKNYDRAEEEALKAKEIVQKSYPPGHPLVAVALNRVAALYIKEGKYAQAESVYKEMLTISQAAVDPKATKPANGPFQLGLSAQVDVSSLNPASEEDRSILDQALSLSKKGFGNTHPVVATALNNLGLVCQLENKPQEALTYYKKSLEISKQIFGANSFQTAAAMQNVASVDLALKQNNEAQALYLDSLNIVKNAPQGQNQVLSVSALNALSRIAVQAGQYKTAEDNLREAFAIASKPSPQAHKMDTGFFLNQADQAIAASEEVDGGTPALKATAMSLSAANSSAGKDSPVAANILFNLADILVKEGRFPEAESTCRQAVDLREKNYGADNPQVAQAYTVYAGIFQKANQFKDAQDALQKALVIYQNQNGTKAAYVSTLKRLAKLAYLQGKYDESKKFEGQATEAQGTNSSSADSNSTEQ
jgi:tetratricopeptide (TPR) repeat protein